MKEIRHGTQAGYSRKCRCELCRRAHAEYNYPLVKANGWKYRKFGPKRLPKAKKAREVKYKIDDLILKDSIASEPVYRFSGFGFKS
jgi:hypothetical protein